MTHGQAERLIAAIRGLYWTGLGIVLAITGLGVDIYSLHH